jgi:hypothetical protein
MLPHSIHGPSQHIPHAVNKHSANSDPSSRPMSNGIASDEPNGEPSDEPNGEPNGDPNGDPTDDHFARDLKKDSIPNESLAHHDHGTPTMHPTLVSDDAEPLEAVHVVQLSAIEHCMPRAYIRVCLAYRLPDDVLLSAVMSRLNEYARKLVDAKPYLAGYVVPAPDATSRVGLAEIQFTDEDFQDFPTVEVRHFSQKEVPYSYDELSKSGLPPSVIRPELVSALPEGTDDERAPAFRMQANVVQGGLIVSVYLHHCIADGTGLGLLLTGAVLVDNVAFQRHLDTNGVPTPSLNSRLAAFAGRKTVVRQNLSWSDHNQISNRCIQYRIRSNTTPTSSKTKPVGRGCIVALSRSKLDGLRTELLQHDPDTFMTPTDALRKFQFIS